MITQPEMVWQRAVDATWTNPEAMCAEGSRVATNESQQLDPLFRLSADKSSGGDALQVSIFAVVIFGSLVLSVLHL
jgi:hypothetical protein